jgi:hypothetical protein
VIAGRAVPLLAPAAGSVDVLVLGEAPGPRGADKSGYPFFGDAAGKHLYRALEGVGAATLAPAVWNGAWDGARFAANALSPAMHRVALTNAFDRCPTDDGEHFRAPSRRELTGDDNFARLQRDLDGLHTRGLKGVLTLGRVAANTMDAFFDAHPMPELTRRAIPHPSAQGLLSMAPNRGKGARMSDLQQMWMEQCQRLLNEAGFRSTP